MRRWVVQGSGCPNRLVATLDPDPPVMEGGLMLGKLQHIMDERYAAIDVVGKGLVIFSA